MAKKPVATLADLPREEAKKAARAAGFQVLADEKALSEFGIQLFNLWADVNVSIAAEGQSDDEYSAFLEVLRDEWLRGMFKRVTKPQMDSFARPGFVLCSADEDEFDQLIRDAQALSALTMGLATAREQFFQAIGDDRKNSFFDMLRVLAEKVEGGILGMRHV